MSRTITRLFDTYGDAERAVGEMERLGVPNSDISLVASNADKAHDHRSAHVPGDGHTAADHAADDAGKGATTGGVIGGVAACWPGLGCSPFLVSALLSRPDGWSLRPLVRPWAQWRAARRAA